MQSIAHTISGELREKLQYAEFWWLLFDGSEDITKTEQEIVYIVSVSSNGEFMSDFLGLIEQGADRTAQAITDGLVRLFHAQAWMTGQRSWSLCAQTGLLLTSVRTTVLCQNYDNLWR